MLKFLFGFLIFVLLTLLTQIGGFAFIAAVFLIPRRFRSIFSRMTAGLSIFVIAYGSLSLAAAATAPLFGRTPLPCFKSAGTTLAMQSPIYCALNRHYVSPKMKAVAVGLSQAVDENYPGTLTLTLDANFPFIDGFPLLPHLSHHDGRKLDFAFFYQSNSGNYLRGETRSPIGYWAFEEASGSDPQPCENQDDLLTLRWNMHWFAAFNNDYALEMDRMRTALRWLTEEGKKLGVSKIFVEPHLTRKLGIEDDIIRFQGCRAARHDDHIHIQVD